MFRDKDYRSLVVYVHEEEEETWGGEQEMDRSVRRSETGAIFDRRIRRRREGGGGQF